MHSTFPRHFWLVVIFCVFLWASSYIDGDAWKIKLSWLTLLSVNYDSSQGWKKNLGFLEKKFLHEIWKTLKFLGFSVLVYK